MTEINILKERQQPSQNKFATSNEATPQEPKRVIGQYNLTCRNKHKSKTQWCSRCLWDEHQTIKRKEVQKQLTTLTGFTTSQINQALKGKKTNGLFPYPARVFLKVDNREQDIPVFFRIKDSSKWIRPKIKKGSYLQVQGHFDNSINSNRKSFTATSYQLLNSNQSQIEYLSHGK